MSRDWTGKYQCYMHYQRAFHEGGIHIILSGHGETAEEAKEMFDHALEACLNNREVFKKDV